MLLLGRSDTVLQDRLVFEREIRLHRAAGKVRSAGCVKEGDDGFYLGVPAHLPDATVWAQRLDQGVAVLEKSGELARILARYGVTER
jgi:ABC-type amino acid transport substrate-binding protein